MLYVRNIYCFGKWFCRICNDFYCYSKFDLARHIYRCHILVDSNCPCGKNYRLKGINLMTHILAKHDQCLFCFTNCKKQKRKSSCKKILYNAVCLEEWSHFEYLPLNGEDVFR